MSADNKILLAVVGVTVVILGLGILMLGKAGGSKPQISDQVVNIDYSKGQKVGSDSAKVRLVEFSDFQCPACRAVSAEVEALIRSNLSDFQFVYKHFPLPQHKSSRKAAVAAEFAGQNGKFFEMGVKLFETQSEWDALGDPTDYFVKLFAELGLDPEAGRKAIVNNDRLDVVLADLNEGNQLGVNSTPTFYLNGKQVNLGVNSSLTEVVKRELAK